MSIGFDAFLTAVTGKDFAETPVDIETFVTEEEFLGLPPLSDYQIRIVAMMSQIYRKDTLLEWLGPEAGQKRWAQTMDEIVLQLGKGSGKDHCSSIAMCYMVYLLLCLKDPARYYGRPKGEGIDLLNIAINADQAKNTFFKQFTNKIENSPWFEGRYDLGNITCSFDKNVTVYSGHSEREAWEGYNFLVVILDEISGYALESSSGHQQAKTAPEIYNTYRAAVDSRFPGLGKVALLSFPRFKGDYIQQRYDEIVEQKETVIRKVMLKLNPDLPDGIHGNEIVVEYEEDKIISYRYPRMWALKRATWEVNPTKDITDYTRNFFSNMSDTLSRFACMPPDAVDAFFKDKTKIEKAFSQPNPFDDIWRWYEWAQPDPHKKYYVHVDLARLHDRCAVSMAHVESFKQIKIGSEMTAPAPFVVVDMVRYWTPTSENAVDFEEVREFIRSLSTRGYNIGLVTFDRWESADMMKYLNSIGMKSERLSVAKKHYQDMAGVVGEERLVGPDIDILQTELLQLRIMPNDKVDHPRKGGKDLADAVCGAIYNAVAYTSPDVNRVVDIHTYGDYQREERNRVDNGVIKAPKAPYGSVVPDDIALYLENMRVI